MRILRTTLSLLLMLFLGTTHAAVQFSEQIRQELKDDLYPLQNVLPGYQRPRVAAPKFVVAEFRVSSDDLRVWSQAVAELLTYRVQYVPGVRLYMPAPYYNHVDAGAEADEDRALLTDVEAFKNLHRSLGIETVLTGVVKSRGETFALLAELVDAASGKVSSKRVWGFSKADLPRVIIEITEWVYQSLNIELTEQELAHIRDSRTLDSDAIQAFIDNYTDLTELDRPLREEKIRQLREDHPDLTLLAIYGLQARHFARDLDEAYTNLDYYKGVRSRFEGNAGVELESYRVMEIESLPKHEVSRRLVNLQQLVIGNPQDPTMMIVYADALINNGETFEGVTVLLEAIDRWPEQYRVWWSLGWALNQHAWQVRGDSYWRDVPETAKQQFTMLSDFADRAIDTALSMNPYSAMLWNMKISSLGSKDGFTDEIIATFDKAVKLAPRDRRIYESALNFSTGKWGGNAMARKHIIEVAEKNNAGAFWVENMKKRHVVDLDNWEKRLGTSEIEIFIKEILDHPYGKYIGAIVALMILSVVFYMGRSSA